MKIEKTEQFPKELHFAALEFTTKSIYHEGDERSRTNPGHGYPAYTETIRYVNYHSFTDIDQLNQWIIKAEKENTKYQLIEARPLEAKIIPIVTIS